MLTDDSKVGEGEKARPLYDLKTKIEVFKMAQDWLSRRKKLNPDGDGDEPEGIENMRRLIDERLTEQRVVRVPTPKPGRPNREEAQVRADYKAVMEPPPADDSALRKMLEKQK